MPETQAGDAPTEATAPENFRLLESELVVVEGGEEFTFRIPTPLDTVRMGLVMRRLQKEIDPEGDAAAEGLDPFTVVFLQVLALFLTCLTSTSATWVYRPGKDGKPAIAWRDWEPDKTQRLLQIWADYSEGVARFHQRGAKPAEPKAPAGR